MIYNLTMVYWGQIPNISGPEWRPAVAGIAAANAIVYIFRYSKVYFKLNEKKLSNQPEFSKYASTLMTSFYDALLLFNYATNNLISFSNFT